MSSAQKTIKYLAIAFAIFLIVTIFSAIASAGYGIIKTINGAGKSTTSELDHNKYNSYLDINLKYSSLKVVNGDYLKVDNNNDKVNVKMDSNKLLITDSSNWLHNDNSEIVVYIPRDIKYDIVNINTGAGEVSVEGFNTKELIMNLGAGKTDIKNVISDRGKISSGTGSVNISECSLNDSKFDLGIGEINISGNITGDTKINSGIGKVVLDLNGSRDDYNFDVNKGIGDVSLNGHSLDDGKLFGTGNNNIKVNGGIGAIVIKTR